MRMNNRAGPGAHGTPYGVEHVESPCFASGRRPYLASKKTEPEGSVFHLTDAYCANFL